ncbi:hematopoietic progenitor cell antigen CD34-like, partial [Clarias magur]
LQKTNILKMEVFNWRKTNSPIILALATVICAVIFRDVNCQMNNSTRRDNISSTSKGVESSQQIGLIPEISGSTESSISSNNSSFPQTSNVVCVNETAVRNKDAVKLILKTKSNCENNKKKIESSPELLCTGDQLKIYQMDNTNEMIITGKCVEGDGKRMIEKFDNDNIKDKVGISKAELVLVRRTQIVLISVLISGLLLAVLLLAAYILQTCHTEAKGACL